MLYTFLLECILQCNLTNVYVLHSGFIGGCLLSSDRLAEGIQVHHNDVNWGDVVIADCCHVLLLIPFGKNAAMHARMQSLHTPYSAICNLAAPECMVAELQIA